MFRQVCVKSSDTFTINLKIMFIFINLSRMMKFPSLMLKFNYFEREKNNLFICLKKKKEKGKSWKEVNSSNWFAAMLRLMTVQKRFIVVQQGINEKNI